MPQPKIGTIHKMPSGKWLARYSAPNGKRYGKSFLTKGDGTKWLQIVYADISSGRWVSPGASATAMRFEDYSSAWLRSRKVKGQPISSVARQYRRPDRLGGAPLGHRSEPRAVGLPRPRRAAGCHGSADRQRSGRSFGLGPDSMRSCSPSAHSSFSAPSGLPSRSPVVLRQRLNRRRLPAIRHSQPPVRR